MPRAPWGTAARSLSWIHPVKMSGAVDEDRADHAGHQRCDGAADGEDGEIWVIRRNSNSGFGIRTQKNSTWPRPSAAIDAAKGQNYRDRHRTQAAV